MKTIVIIDDEKDFCFFVQRNLEARTDYTIVECHDSGRAVKTVEDEQPVLVLLDIIMPGKSGAEIAEELKQNPKTSKIPVVFLTAVVNEDETTARKDVIGGHYFIAKPVKIEKLIEMIDSIVVK